mgnify:CR=1 FL=1
MTKLTLITRVECFVELESAKKQNEADRKAIDDLVRERDILNKNMLKAAAATQKQLSLVKLHEQSKKTLEQEIQNYKEEVRKITLEKWQSNNYKTGISVSPSAFRLRSSVRSSISWRRRETVTSMRLAT